VTNGDCSFDFSSATNPDDTTFSTDNLSPEFGVQYIVNDSSNIYAKWNRSFRAGGFNLRNTSPIPEDLLSFDDEEVESTEIGWKYQSPNNSTLNVALFYTQIDDLQREVNTADPDQGITQVIRNTANADIHGFELDGKWVINDKLVLTGSLGYIDGEYTDIFSDLTGDGVINQDDFDLDIPRLTDFSYSLGVIYSTRLGNLGEGNFQLNYGHKSETAFTDNNLGFVEATSRVDGNFTLVRDNGTSISIYGKNLTNEVIFSGDAPLPETLGGVPLGGTLSPLTKGRVIGLEVQHDF